MTAFFNSIADFLGNIASWFTNLLSSLGMLFTTIPRAWAWFQYIMSFIPAPVAIFAGLAVTLSILMLVIGRNS